MRPFLFSINGKRLRWVVESRLRKKLYFSTINCNAVKKLIYFILFLLTQATVFSQTTITSEGTDSLMFFTNGNKSLVVSPSGKIRMGTVKNMSSSAVLQINSTTGGILIPRLNTTQRNAMTGLVAGVLIYNSDNQQFETYNGSIWDPILTDANLPNPSSIADADNDTRVETEQSADEDFIRFTANSTEAITIDNTGKVGINNTSPNAPLDINGKVIQNTTISAGSGSSNISRVNNIYLSSGTQSGALRAVDNIVNISTAAVTSGDVSTGTEVSASRNVVSVTSSGTTNQLFGTVNAVSTAGAIGGNTDSYGTLNMVSHGATSGTINNAIGGSSIVENSGGGALISAMGHTISVQNTGIGTITNAYGLFIGNINTATTENVALLTMAGQVRFNDGGNATSHFNIKTVGKSNMFFVDATNDRVGLGTATPATTLDIDVDGGAVLIPRKSTAGDPTGADGMIYYNTNMSKFRVYEGGAWKDWISAGSGGDFMADGSVPMTGQFLGIGGTTALPGISFSGDNDNGLALPVADQLTLSTAGLERMRIDNNGYVGVGTTPSSLLHVATDNNQEGIIMQTSNNTGSGGVFVIKSRGTKGAPTAVIAGDYLGSFGFNGYDGTTFSSPIAGMAAVATENFSPTNQGTELIFTSTPNGTTSEIERIRISQSGYVGIGTQQPQAHLHIAADGGVYQAIQSASGAPVLAFMNSGNTITSPTASPSGSPLGTLEFYGHDGGSFANAGSIALVPTQNFSGSNYGTRMGFYTTEENTTVPNLRMVIDHNGYLGIGTATPSARLDVDSDGGSILIPRKSTAGDPTGINGMIYYNANMAKFRVYEGGAWKDWVFTSGTAPWSYSSPNVYLTTLSDYVGIGTNSPGYNLDVQGGANTMLNISSSASATNTMAGFRLSMYDSYIGTHYNIYSEKDDATPNSGSSDFIMRKDFSTGGGYLKFFKYNNSTNDVIINDSKTSGSGWGNFVVANGNVGLATFSPPELLSLQGRIHMTSITAPTPTTDRLYNENGNLYWNGVQLDVSGTSELKDADNNTKVEVEQSANEDKIRFSTAGVERMIIDAAGNVGIGTSSPIFNFHLNYDAGSFNVIQTSSETGNVTLALSRTRGTSSSPTAVSSGDKLGELTFLGHDGTSYNESAMIQALATENHGVSMAGGELRFRTTLNGTTASNDRMIITNDGKVGIGTLSPDEKLHVVHNQDIHKKTIYGVASQMTTSSDYYNIGVTGFATSDANAYGFGTGVSGVAKPSVAAGAGLYGAIGVYAGLNSMVPNVGFGGTHYAFYADAGGDAVTKYAGVFMNGNVGIGTSSPSTARLQVEESTTIEGIRINNSGTNAGGGFYNTNASNTSDVITISTNGQNSKGLSVTHTGTSGAGTDYSIYATNTGATGSTANVAGYFSASGATNNYAGIFDQGNVGIGTTTPGYALHVYRSAAGIFASSIENTDATGWGLEVRTNNATSAVNAFDIYTGGTNRFVVRGDGNVGIGKAAPETKLHIGGDAELRVGDGTATAAQKITMYTPGAGFTQILEGGGDNNKLGLQATSSSGDAILIKTKDAGGTQTNRLSFTAGVATAVANFTSTSVGINESAPGSSLVIKGVGSTSATSSLHILNSGGSTGLFVRDDGNIGVGTNSPTTNTRLAIKDGHLQSQQTAAPTVAAGAALGTIAFTAPTLQNATDVAGKILFKPGSDATQGAMAVITFNKTYATAPIVVLTPANNMGSQGADSHQIYVTTNTTSFTVFYNVDPNTAPDLNAAAQHYFYHVIETQ